MELRVGNKYRLGRKIGSGSFGDIYLGKHPPPSSSSSSPPPFIPFIPLISLCRSSAACPREFLVSRQARHSMPSAPPLFTPSRLLSSFVYTVDFVYSTQESVKPRANSYVIPPFLSFSSHSVIPIFHSSTLVFFVFFTSHRVDVYVSAETSLLDLFLYSQVPIFLRVRKSLSS